VYTVGQPITVQWISCNVLNLSIGLLKGGKDFGTLTQPSIPASTGSFTFTATNPAEAFNGMTTNAYQVGLVQSESPNVLVKSPSFTVHQ
jgi:hypothetical protein